LKVGIFILKISKMIPKSAIAIFATLLVAIEAKSSQDLIGERLKGFHDHFTSQANVIKDAGINTDKIMNSLSAQLKSLLQDAVKEMNDLEAENKRLNGELEKVTTECHNALKQCKSMVEDLGRKAIELQHQLDAEKKTTASLKKEIQDLKQDNADCQDANKKLTEKNKVLEDDKEKLDEENGKLKTDLAECKTVSAKYETDLAKCETDSAKCKKDLEALGKVCHDGLLECKSNLEDIGEKWVKCDKDLKDCTGHQKTCSECITKNKDLTEKLGKCETQLKKSETENEILQNERDKYLVDLEVCRGGWEKVNGRYVKHFSDQKVTWSEAKASCEERNSKLLMVKDDVTQEWTKKIHTPVWIGATDQGHEGDWKWVDGSSVDKTKKSKHWGAGEPDSGLGLVEEDCLATGFELLWIHHGQWADEVCKSKFTFVCELPKV